MPSWYGGMQWCSWLRHYSTSWQVAGWIPAGVTGIFNWHNPSGRTQPLTEFSTRCKEGQCIELMTLPPSCADCHKIRKPQPPATLKACPGIYRDCFTFTFTLAVAAMVWCLIKYRFNFAFIRDICLEFGFMIRSVRLNFTWMHLCLL
jgi:hypothetical protein